jgi:hypothetical protein
LAQTSPCHDDSIGIYLVRGWQTIESTKIARKQLKYVPVCLLCDLGRISRSRANANASAERSGESGLVRSHGRQVVTATNTDHSHIALSGLSNLSTNIPLGWAASPAWLCDEKHPVSRELVVGSGLLVQSSPSTNSVSHRRDTSYSYAISRLSRPGLHPLTVGQTRSSSADRGPGAPSHQSLPETRPGAAHRPHFPRSDL